MRQIALLCCLGMMMVLGGMNPASADTFLSVYDDIPLPLGMQEVSDSGVSFDTPAGRLVEAYAQGPLNVAQVLAFYQESLPQLGWRLAESSDEEKNYRWVRDSETLQLKLSVLKDSNLLIWFTISNG